MKLGLELYSFLVKFCPYFNPHFFLPKGKPTLFGSANLKIVPPEHYMFWFLVNIIDHLCHNMHWQTHIFLIILSGFSFCPQFSHVFPSNLVRFFLPVLVWLNFLRQQSHPSSRCIFFHPRSESTIKNNLKFIQRFDHRKYVYR